MNIKIIPKRFIPFCTAVGVGISLLIPAAATAKDNTYTVTFYCSACNSPKHTDTTAMPDSPAFVGSCASNDFPLGSTIYVQGYGLLYVNDRMAERGKIDIYQGNFDRCECTGKDRRAAWRYE